jgi:hypothetical protein
MLLGLLIWRVALLSPNVLQNSLTSCPEITRQLRTLRILGGLCQFPKRNKICTTVDFFLLPWVRMCSGKYPREGTIFSRQNVLWCFLTDGFQI